MALQYGAVTPASFTAQLIQDPALRILMSKTTIQENAEYTRKYPGEYNCRMEIASRTGKRWVAETSYPKGHRLNPLSDLSVEEKFRHLTSDELTESQCGQALELVWSLDSQSSLNALYDSLVV